MSRLRPSIFSHIRTTTTYYFMQCTRSNASTKYSVDREIRNSRNEICQLASQRVGAGRGEQGVWGVSIRPEPPPGDCSQKILRPAEQHVHSTCTGVATRLRRALICCRGLDGELKKCPNHNVVGSGPKRLSQRRNCSLARLSQQSQRASNLSGTPKPKIKLQLLPVFPVALYLYPRRDRSRTIMS